MRSDSKIAVDRAVPSPNDSATANPIGEVFTQTELAQRWRLSTATIERWRSDGVGPKFLKLRGGVRYRKEDVVEFEHTCLRQSTSQRA